MGAPMTYGIYDTKDNCWLGDASGPKTFEDFTLARVAAQIVEDRITGTDLGCRFRAQELPSSGPWHKRDEVLTQRTSLESLIRLENGGQ